MKQKAVVFSAILVCVWLAVFVAVGVSVVHARSYTKHIVDTDKMFYYGQAAVYKTVEVTLCDSCGGEAGQMGGVVTYSFVNSTPEVSICGKCAARAMILVTNLLKARQHRGARNLSWPDIFWSETDMWPVEPSTPCSMCGR